MTESKGTFERARSGSLGTGVSCWQQEERGHSVDSWLAQCLVGYQLINMIGCFVGATPWNPRTLLL